MRGVGVGDGDADGEGDGATTIAAGGSADAAGEGAADGTGETAGLGVVVAGVGTETDGRAGVGRVGPCATRNGNEDCGLWGKA